AGRPMIVLTGGGKGVGHYVVIVAWGGGNVIVQDPAVGPNRVLPEIEFITKWAGNGNWALLVLPPGPMMSADAADSSGWNDSPETGEDACVAMVDKGIRQALDGDTDAAEVTFQAAAALSRIRGRRTRGGCWPEVASSSATSKGRSMPGIRSRNHAAT
ncbi:MAG: hypothetical protein FD129_2846, partial [bacterium]